MDFSTDELTVLQRFSEKTHIAGGPRLGYVLRKTAVSAGQDPAFDADGALAGLVEKGLLASSENGDFVFLTEQGVEALGA